MRPPIGNRLFRRCHTTMHYGTLPAAMLILSIHRHLLIKALILTITKGRILCNLTNLPSHAFARTSFFPFTLDTGGMKNKIGSLPSMLAFHEYTIKKTIGISIARQNLQTMSGPTSPWHIRQYTAGISVCI